MTGDSEYEAGYRDIWLMRHQGLVVGLIFALMGVGMLVTIVIAVVISMHSEYGDVPDAFITWGVSLSVGGPVLLAAIAGASTLHRDGWVLGTGFGIGFILVPVGLSLHQPTLLIAGIVLIVLAVPAFYLLGWRRGVAMNLAGVGIQRRPRAGRAESRRRRRR